MTESEQLLIEMSGEPIFFTLPGDVGGQIGIEAVDPRDLERIKPGTRILIGRPSEGFETTIVEVHW